MQNFSKGIMSIGFRILKIEILIEQWSCVFDEVCSRSVYQMYGYE